ncbi:MAG: TIGR04086 family membrane protein [Oscillospiraceae bacterium]|jgi:putative membrane protein (TIGR04086 family)|nr:TIGR04086 family membrane protein [Oscillospiraceae bacterium]
MRKQEVVSESKQLLRAVLIGTGVSFAILLGLLLFAAGFISGGVIDESAMRAAVLIIVAVGVLIGSISAARLCDARGFLAGTLVGLMVFAVLFCAGLIVSYPDMAGVPAVAMITVLCGIGGAMPRVYLKQRRAGKHKRKKR